MNVGRLLPLALLWIKSIIKAVYLRLPLFNKSFVILSSGRSGSTLLVQFLNCHPSISCHGELLNREKLNSNLVVDGRGFNQGMLIRYILSRLLPLNPFKPLTGFKVFNEQLEYCKLPLSRLTSGLCNPPIVVLYRENLLETYVSLRIAESNDIWFSEDIVNSCSFEVQWKDFFEYCVGERRRWEKSMRHLSVTRDRVLFLSFEELVSGREEAMGRIFGFLNLKNCYVVACSKRQNPQPLEEKVSNCSEILERAERERLSLNLTKDWLQKCMHENFKND